MEFNIKRLMFLLKLDNQKILFEKAIKVLAVIIGIVVLIRSYHGIGHDDNCTNCIYIRFVILFLISSVIVGTLVFIDTSKDSDRVTMLTLPASTLEKIMSKFVISMVVFPIVIIMMYYIGFNIIKLVTHLFSEFHFVGKAFPNDPPFSDIYYVGLVIISVFTYGSIRYNNLSFVKIVLRLLGIILIAALISFLLALILIPPFRAEVFGMPHMKPMLQDDHSITEDHWFLQLAIFSYYYLLIPIFWTMSYFSLKEKEA